MFVRRHKESKKTNRNTNQNTRSGADPGRKAAKMYYHFTYTSGSNPYIAKTEKERDRVIERHENAGDQVREIQPGFYVIDDNAADLFGTDPNRDQLQH